MQQDLNFSSLQNQVSLSLIKQPSERETSKHRLSHFAKAAKRRTLRTHETPQVLFEEDGESGEKSEEIANQRENQFAQSKKAVPYQVEDKTPEFRADGFFRQSNAPQYQAKRILVAPEDEPEVELKCETESVIGNSFSIADKHIKAPNEYQYHSRAMPEKRQITLPKMPPSQVTKNIIPDDQEETSPAEQGIPGIEHLQIHFESLFLQSRYTGKFMNQEIEKDYQVHFHKDFREIAQITVWGALLFDIALIAWYVYRGGLKGENEEIVKYGDSNNSTPYYSASITATSIVIMLVHKVFANRYKAAALLFSNLQTAVVFICHTEAYIQSFKQLSQSSSLPLIMALICGLSTISYDQVWLLITYLLLAVYQILRLKEVTVYADLIIQKVNEDTTLIPNNETYMITEEPSQNSCSQVMNDVFHSLTRDAFNFNISLAIAFIFLSLFARAYSQRERARFVQKKQQLQLLQMFGGLVAKHHDGILITAGEKIIMHNGRVSEIFAHQPIPDKGQSNGGIQKSQISKEDNNHKASIKNQPAQNQRQDQSGQLNRRKLESDKWGVVGEVVRRMFRKKGTQQQVVQEDKVSNTIIERLRATQIEQEEAEELEGQASQYISTQRKGTNSMGRDYGQSGMLLDEIIQHKPLTQNSFNLQPQQDHGSSSNEHTSSHNNPSNEYSYPLMYQKQQRGQFGEEGAASAYSLQLRQYRDIDQSFNSNGLFNSSCNAFEEYQKKSYQAGESQNQQAKNTCHVSIWDYILRRQSEQKDNQNDCSQAAQNNQAEEIQADQTYGHIFEDQIEESINPSLLLRRMDSKFRVPPPSSQLSMLSQRDGHYFRVPLPHKAIDSSPNKRDQEQDSQEGKRVQVFTQTITMGSKNVVITTIRDMSSLLELEKQKNITKTQTLAFASAAHEFRNPLNAIVASLELLNPLIDHKKGSQYYSIAKSCSNLMLFLVRDILDFAQIESRSLILSVEATSMSSLVNECVEALSFKAQEKGLQLSSNTKVQPFDQLNSLVPHNEMDVLTDSNRVKQILINLLSNAIKYTEHGFVRIEVTRPGGGSSTPKKQSHGQRLLAKHQQIRRQSFQIDQEREPSKNMLKIAVEDTGVGMSVSQMEKLFTPYTKIMSNRKLNKEGVGLGLAVSRNIARALGGDILVESKVGKGSRFTLTIPYAPVPSQTMKMCSYSVNDPSNSPVNEGSSKGGGKKIQTTFGRQFAQFKQEKRFASSLTVSPEMTC
ncbi:hypothetical protein FGO68_gene8607 [Halteria grandinella]|uniref:histidine kinase n=1 Tax=Halteria grandinella TaxID=5974 RepID=A0A8J8T955_HALGN|nr:hypothetical protein FGO68_gene8607 [Halteria grandinella]